MSSLGTVDRILTHVSGPRSCAIDACAGRPPLPWGWLACGSTSALIKIKGHSAGVKGGGRQMPVRAILQNFAHNRLTLAVSLTHRRTMQSSAAPNLLGLTAEDRKIKLSASTECLTRTLPREMSTKPPPETCWTVCWMAIMLQSSHMELQDAAKHTRSRGQCKRLVSSS